MQCLIKWGSCLSPHIFKHWNICIVAATFQTRIQYDENIPYLRSHAYLLPSDTHTHTHKRNILRTHSKSVTLLERCFPLLQWVVCQKNFSPTCQHPWCESGIHLLAAEHTPCSYFWCSSVTFWPVRLSSSSGSPPSLQLALSLLKVCWFFVLWLGFIEACVACFFILTGMTLFSGLASWDFSNYLTRFVTSSRINSFFRHWISCSTFTIPRHKNIFPFHFFPSHSPHLTH